MIRIGRYRLGFAQASMIVGFVVLMALFATLAYGIVSHFALALIDRFRNS